jgi:FtsZ-interacting cell division protein ZipA
MADWASLVVPAASALAGVAVTQMWTSRNEERRWQREERKTVYESRRTAVAQYILAHNSAIDATRELVRTANDAPEHASRLADYHLKWHETYERQLELLLLLPRQARTAVESQVAAAFAWRERALSAHAAIDPPRNEALIEELHPWMHQGLPHE